MLTPAVQTYSLVNATVRARNSNTLTPEIWETLIRARDLDGTLTLLSKTVYAPSLGLERHLLTPRRVAYQIRWHLAHSYEKLIRLMPEPGRQLLIQLWRLYEVDNLKATLRGIHAGASWEQVLYLLQPMGRQTALSPGLLEIMIRSGDVPRAVRLVRDTPYFETLDHALDRYRSEESLFPLEVALDLDYHRDLWQTIGLLTGQDQGWALRLAGSVLDNNNLLWAIRYRVYHHLSEEEIINYTLPFGYLVHDEDIRAIAAGADVAAIVKRIYPGVEGVDQISGQPILWLSTLEVALQRHIVRLCRSAFIGNPFHIGVPLAYLLLTEREIRDLTVVIEAKASGIPQKTFVPMLEMQSFLDLSV